MKLLGKILEGLGEEAETITWNVEKVRKNYNVIVLEDNAQIDSIRMFVE